MSSSGLGESGDQFGIMTQTRKGQWDRQHGTKHCKFVCKNLNKNSGNATEMLRMLRNVKGCYVEFCDDQARQEDTEKWRQHQESTKEMLRHIEQCCGDAEKCYSLCQENIGRHPEMFCYHLIYFRHQENSWEMPGDIKKCQENFGGHWENFGKTPRKFCFLFFLISHFRKISPKENAQQLQH